MMLLLKYFCEKRLHIFPGEFIRVLIICEPLDTPFVGLRIGPGMHSATEEDHLSVCAGFPHAILLCFDW